MTGCPSSAVTVREDARVNVVDRVVAGYERAVVRVRARWGLVDHIWLATDRLADVLGSRLAAAISYYGFFAAFSLAVVGYSILGRALNSEATDGVVGAINEYLVTALPWVVDTAAQVGQGEVTALGLVALLVTGIGWVEALRSSQRGVWLLDQHPGNWILRRVLDLVVLVGLGVLLALSVVTTYLIDLALDQVAPNTTLGAMLLRSSGPALTFVVNLIIAAATLTVLPRLRLSPRRLALPVLVVAAGIQLLNTIGGWFIARTESRPAYQLVAGAVGLLVYLYLLNQLILLGAALAATSRSGTVRDLAAGPPEEPTGEPARADEAPETPAPSGDESENVGEPSGPTVRKPR
jgi:membrane protein